MTADPYQDACFRSILCMPPFPYLLLSPTDWYYYIINALEFIWFYIIIASSLILLVTVHILPSQVTFVQNFK